MLAIGNTLKLTPKDQLKNPKQKLFHVKHIPEFIEFVSTAVQYIKEGKALHIQLLSSDRYKFHEVRVAYFAYLGDVKKRADYDGETDVAKMHEDFKRRFLLKIIARKHEWFADLVIAAAQVDENGNKTQTAEKMQKAVDGLTSLADGSIVSTKMLREYFDRVKMAIENQHYEKVGG